MEIADMADEGVNGGRRGIEALYDELEFGDREPLVCFEPMLPKVYDVMLPSLDARLNFIGVGKRHAAFLRHFHNGGVRCRHADILSEKTKLLTAILTKLLDVNGILGHGRDG